MDNSEENLKNNTITVNTESTTKVMNAILWLEQNNIEYTVDFNWPCSYYDFRFQDKHDASFFALKWS